MFYLAKFQITMRLKGKVGQCLLTLFGEKRRSCGRSSRPRSEAAQAQTNNSLAPRPPYKEMLHIIKSLELICMCLYIFTKKQIVIMAAAPAQTNNRSTFRAWRFFKKSTVFWRGVTKSFLNVSRGEGGHRFRKIS